MDMEARSYSPEAARPLLQKVRRRGGGAACVAVGRPPRHAVLRWRDSSTHQARCTHQCAHPQVKEYKADLLTLKNDAQRASTAAAAAGGGGADARAELGLAGDYYQVDLGGCTAIQQCVASQQLWHGRAGDAPLAQQPSTQLSACSSLRARRRRRGSATAC